MRTFGLKSALHAHHSFLPRLTTLMLYYVAGRPDLMEQALGDQAQRLHRLLLNLFFKVPPVRNSHRRVFYYFPSLRTL